ncbi:MAG: chemotaxis protein CheR [Geobacteraceae bacterium GWC2_58_44]|nr:MAG: chemotaxis protein CheR [Geobacteraceae bacterium GWC2_58_44]HBG07551.1 chemotaxis protein CheR [Geobacter sp.]
MELSFTPTLDQGEAARRLDDLLIPGSLLDADLERRVDRLAGAFQSFAASYPLPLWAPGLIIDHEMRGLTEALFPMSQVRGAFDLVLRRGCRFPPLLSGSYLHSAASWLDLLHKFRPQLLRADPASTLRELAADPDARRRFLFALLLPHHFGGAFDRYPLQSQWLELWLRENSERLNGRIRALDSACGSGEGSYGLAELVSAAGFGGEGCVVDGSTLEPIELFAAAHLFFPHDPDREREYRRRVAPLLMETAPVPMEFYLDEVGSATSREPYDLILCNGLLGGPLLHETAELSGAIEALASRLTPGGVLLAADRFHAGWRLRVPAEKLCDMMQEHGLTPLQVPAGVAGLKQR